MPNRRAACALASSALASFSAVPAARAERSRTEGYSLQRSEREWAYVLSGQQYYILRQGGTEQPNTSPLYTEKRQGSFVCAACNTALFSSEAKFNSGTGWPSFATMLEGVEVAKNNPLLAAVGGTEVRCRTCGGHLGDVFADGFLFQGTPAAVSGKRFCIDGGALVFRPSDGSEPVSGEAPAKPVELPSWLQPPKVGSSGAQRAY
uniref:MsrB domain-containing protein n=1 Tax=Prymnesium polylepis TaxID=72548 RepID=A0A7S4I2G2_9EUKA